MHGTALAPSWVMPTLGPELVSISRSEQRRRPEPVRGCAQNSLCRERDRQEPLFRAGRCGQLEPDGHAGAIETDGHRDRAEPEIIDGDGVAHDAAIDSEV